VGGLAGEGVGKEEGLTRCRFVAADGWGSVGSRPAAAHREHGRCELCSGGPPVWEEARAAPVGCRV
jgi:hypothetical protein